MAGYSEDLRVKGCRVFEKRAHDKGNSRDVWGSMKSVSLWKKMDKEGKRLVFGFVPRSPHRINHEKLLAYVKEHPNAYLREIAAHFSVGLTTIWNAFHRLSVKKNEKFTKKRIQKSGKNLQNS